MPLGDGLDKARRALRKLKPRGQTSSRGALWALLALMLALIGLLYMWQAALLPNVYVDAPAASASSSLVRPAQVPADPVVEAPKLDPPQTPVPSSSAAAGTKAQQRYANGFDPTTTVAFGIPVGGRTQRAAQLDDILTTLLDGGAPARSIFVLEDVLGRPGAVADQSVASVAQKHGVRVVSSAVSRADMPETSANFGIHLARHYKFMLDYLLIGPEAAGVSAVGDPAAGPDGRGPNTPPFSFAVLIEDDLVLAPDFVKYFYSMAGVMAADPTLYCVSAHQDNAFTGTSWERVRTQADGTKSLDPLSFDFRRGNHFMAPGWMTSAAIYTTVVRPRWLDSAGQYTHAEELHLRNGHWDRFFDSLIGDRDCIFPAVPRIVHRGADGFTVSQRAQAELYSNLRLSALSPDTDYGDLARLTRAGYVDATKQFINDAFRLGAPEETRRFRRARLVLLVSSVHSDKDEAWNALLNGYFGLIGVGGYGGWEGYVKVRGIFNGAVFVQWAENDVLLVGAYSPYAPHVDAKKFALEIIPRSIGCFQDHGNQRDLPHHASYYTPANLSPRACLSTCVHLGFKYAGLQAGMECWCGHQYGQHGAEPPLAATGGCTAACTAASEPVLGLDGTSEPASCGGAWLNSIYWNSGAHDLHVQSLKPPSDLAFLAAKPGQSCTDACASSSSPRALAQGQSWRCADTLFPLLHRTCNILQDLLGCPAGCREEEDIARGVYSPGSASNLPQDKCVLSKGRYLRCDAKPPPHERDYRRACVCQAPPRSDSSGV